MSFMESMALVTECGTPALSTILALVKHLLAFTTLETTGHTLHPLPGSSGNLEVPYDGNPSNELPT